MPVRVRITVAAWVAPRVCSGCPRRPASRTATHPSTRSGSSSTSLTRGCRGRYLAVSGSFGRPPRAISSATESGGGAAAFRRRCRNRSRTSRSSSLSASLPYSVRARSGPRLSPSSNTEVSSGDSRTPRWNCAGGGRRRDSTSATGNVMIGIEAVNFGILRFPVFSSYIPTAPTKSNSASGDTSTLHELQELRYYASQLDRPRCRCSSQLPLPIKDRGAAAPDSSRSAIRPAHAGQVVPFRAPPALPAAGCPLSTEARARQLLDARMDSVRALVKARQALRDAETADLKAYRTATGAPDPSHPLGLES